MHSSFVRAVEMPVHDNQTFMIEGPPGAEKSGTLGQRLRFLLEKGVPGYAILVLVPDRNSEGRLRETIGELELGPFGTVEIHTYYGLANRLVRLFWPLVAADAGFATPERPPIFLNYETAQYAMGQLIAPMLQQGYFEGLAIRPQRVLSQLLDSLNKAAVNGYPIAEVGPRLKGAWTGDETRLRYYEQVQQCLELFRSHCLRYGLLDFSLVAEVFHRYLVEKPEFWRYFTEHYRHVLVDSLEETVPVAQDLILRLLPLCDSALMGYDPHGGYRVFLGGDATGAARLKDVCRETLVVDDGGLCAAAVEMFRARLGRRLGQSQPLPESGRAGQAVRALIQTRYRVRMLAEVAREIIRLVESGVAPGDIAVVAPYADGVMRFMLGEAFKTAEVPHTVVRRFESLREEPVVRACLTLAALAHPDWDEQPPPYDVAEALGLALKPLDAVRTALLVQKLYDGRHGGLKARDGLAVADQERIGFAALERYDRLRAWFATYQQGSALPFDHFLRRLFGDIMSGPELMPEDAAVYSKLIASAAGFRQVVPALGFEVQALGRRYAEMVSQGVVAAQYLTGLEVEATAESVVLIAPVHTYLLSDHVARFQFWLDIGSMGWWTPPHQPLTNHHVLGRRWESNDKWTDAVDFEIRNRILFRLVSGLCQRCREGIYLCASELETSGEPQDSPLMRAAQQVLQEDS
jgi:hypothetical protein